MAGRHHLTLRSLTSLVRRLRPVTTAGVALATVVAGAAILRVVVAVGGDGGTGPAAAAPPAVVVTLTDGESVPAPAPPVATGSTGPDAPLPSTPPAPPATGATTPAGGVASTRSPTSPQIPVGRPSPSPSPPRPVTRAYEAESQANTRTGGVAQMACAACSGGMSIGWVGYQNTLRFNGVLSTAGGALPLTIYYLNGGPTYTTQISVNGAAAIVVTMVATGGWASVGSVSVTVRLRAGANQLTFANGASWVPPLDRISIRDPAG